VSEPTDQPVEKIDSLPTNEELGIEKIPMVVAGGQRSEPRPTRVAKLLSFEGLVVSEMDKPAKFRRHL
jgi:hypothetical protein